MPHPSSPPPCSFQAKSKHLASPNPSRAASVHSPFVRVFLLIAAITRVLKLSFAVVIAFFVCWAPFHAQRLMTVYINPAEWTPELLLAQSHLFYISGVLYFLSCTVNPILYNLLSRKFRQAFKRTLCRCCFNLDTHSIPAFYKLKAKFVGAEHPLRPHPSNSCFLYQDNAIRLAKFTDNEVRKGHRLLPYGYPSTDETTCKNSSPTQGNTSAAHAHSDGRLHRICRHKYCSSRRGNNLSGMSPSGSVGPQVVVTPKSRTLVSYPDILCHSRPDLAQHAHSERYSLPDRLQYTFKNSCVVSW
ncbi:tachykinin-like peptides receptor 86C [Physella acuta]|uniref:tachykinin-like peptides receptor 86C n=1 Tax=Physella acuta TaxID=109671 RepID=UPI0027DD0056|nr:tachykinin-like peptides receptor 86C [Physella acuta]